MMTYNSEVVLPLDVKYNLNKNGNSDGDQEPLDFATFDVLSLATKASLIIDDVSGKIKKGQEKQKRDFLSYTFFNSQDSC